MKKQELMQSFLKLKEKLCKDKKLTVVVIVSIVLTAVLFISEIGTNGQTDEATGKTAVNYEVELEGRLCELIRSIDGAGEVRVMITFSNGNESVYAKNSSAENEEGADDAKTRGQQEYVIVKRGSNEEGLVLKTVYPSVSGVAVVCHGAESAYVRQRIIETVTAVLDVSSARVSVVKMKTEGDRS